MTGPNTSPKKPNMKEVQLTSTYYLHSPESREQLVNSLCYGILPGIPGKGHGTAMYCISGGPLQGDDIFFWVPAPVVTPEAYCPTWPCARTSMSFIIASSRAEQAIRHCPIHFLVTKPGPFWPHWKCGGFLLFCGCQQLCCCQYPDKFQ